MDITDLDEDEFAHLVQWIARTSTENAPVDLRGAPAWRFARARAAVDAGEITEFPDIGNIDNSNSSG
jgi:hypothetical protein